MYYKPSKKRGYRKKIIRKFLFKIVFPVFIFFILSFIFLNSNFLKITGVSVSYGDEILKDKILEKIEKIKDGKYLFLFNKDSYLFFPKNRIKNEIFDEFDFVGDIKISKDNGVYSFEILNKIPKILFIQEDFNDEDTDIKKEKNDIKFYSEEGSFFSLKKYEGREDLVTLYSKNKIENKIFIKINDILNLFEEENLKILDIYIDEFGDFVFVTSGNVKIIVGKNYKKEEFFKNFHNLVKNKEFKISPVTSIFKTDFAYINLLNGKKIIYCKKGDICQSNY